MSVAIKPERWVLNPPKVKSLNESFRRCKLIARKHYENFPVGSLLIPKHLQPYVFSLYAFARTADDFADEPGYSDAERLVYLNEWEELFRKSLTSKTQHPIMWAVSETIRKHELPPILFLDLLSAFKQDVSVRRYETIDHLLDYCSRSANPIGRLMLLLFGYRDQELFTYSDAICTALQLTNFWQDVPVDIIKNRIYIPQVDMQAYHVTEDQIETGDNGIQIRNLIRFEVDRTSTMFKMGEPLLKHLHGRFKWEIKAILVGGTRILRKIEKIQYNVVRKRPALTFTDTPALVYKFFFS
jgi:hydroxysqualene synthase